MSALDHTTQAARLAVVVTELCDAYPEWGICWEVERRAKVRGIQMAQSQSLGTGAADQFGYVSATDAAVETVRIGQQIKALEAERDYLMFTIKRGL